uniref:Uncharacterized protein n=1 Tax=Caenorhabditis japonica TaxID=281687 RepID=A0A8R1E3P9_CAEJA
MVKSAPDKVLTTVGGASYAKSTDADFKRYLAAHSYEVRTQSESPLNNNFTRLNKHFICNGCGSQLRRNERCCGTKITFYRVGGSHQLQDLVKQFMPDILRIRRKLRDGSEKNHNLSGSYLKKLWEAEDINRLNLSVVASIDGVSLEGNTSQKVWPVSLMLVDIPTADMQRATSLVINGLAEGRENPGTHFWNTVVPMVYADIEGTDCEIKGYRIHFTIVSWTCDQPAKRALFGMRGHNSEETLSSSSDKRSDVFVNDSNFHQNLCKKVRVPPDFTVTDMSNGSEKLTVWFTYIGWTRKIVFLQFFRVNFGLAALMNESLTSLARLSIVSLMLLTNQMYSNVRVSNLFFVHLTAVARWALSTASPRYMVTKAHELVSHLPYTTEMFGNNAPLSTFSFEHLYKHFLKGYNPQLTNGFIEKAINRLITSTAVRRELRSRAKNPKTSAMVHFLEVTPELKPFKNSWKCPISVLDSIDSLESLTEYNKFACVSLSCGRLQSTYSSTCTTSDIFFAKNSAGVHACFRFIAICVHGCEVKILAERVRSLCSTTEFPLLKKDAEDLNAPGNTYAHNLLRSLKNFPGLIQGRLSGEREIIKLDDVKGVGAYISQNSISYYLQLNGAFVHH